MSDGAMCFYCRRYRCICEDEVTPPKPIDTAEEAAPAEAIQELVSKRHKKGCPCRINDRNLDSCDSNCPNCTCEPKPEPPQAETSESAGEVDDSVAQAIDILTNVPHKRQVYQQAERVYCHLVKRMFDECGSFKAQEFIRQVQSGEHDVPSPWAHQPSTLPQSSQQGHINYLSEALLDKSNAATWGSRNGEPWLGVPTSVVRAIVESAQSQPQSQPSSLAGTFEEREVQPVGKRAAETVQAYLDKYGDDSEQVMDMLARHLWIARDAAEMWKAKAKQSQPVIEPLVEVVQKLVDTNFWHPFSLPLSRAQQDIINMANNALQQFRKAQKGLGK